jgi:23S rRNA (cytosine1962-C5)-methyltransferase
VLTPEPVFLVLTAYAVKASALTLYYAVDEMMKSFKGITQSGEVVLTEKSGGRHLSMAIFARWSNNKIAIAQAGGEATAE